MTRNIQLLRKYSQPASKDCNGKIGCQMGQIWKRGILIEQLPLSDWPLGISIEHLFKKKFIMYTVLCLQDRKDTRSHESPCAF